MQSVFGGVIGDLAADTELIKHQATLSFQSQKLSMELKDRELQRKHELAKAAMEVKRLKLLSKIPPAALGLGTESVPGWVFQTPAASPLTSGSSGPSSHASNSPFAPSPSLPTKMEPRFTESGDISNSTPHDIDFSGVPGMNLQNIDMQGVDWNLLHIDFSQFSTQ